MRVIEVVHRHLNFRVSIRPDLESAHRSVGTVALKAGNYDFIEADLRVVWILWRAGIDYDDTDQLLGVFDNYDQVAALLKKFESLHGYSMEDYFITGHEIGRDNEILARYHSEAGNAPD